MGRFNLNREELDAVMKGPQSPPVITIPLDEYNQLKLLKIQAAAGKIYKRMLDEQTREHWDEIGKQAEIAMAVLTSEPFMWLMAGSDHQDYQIDRLRPLWDRYRAAGGKNWAGN